MFKKILIANRGEIACRIMRTCRDMGIMTVAVYSDADQDALHTSIAGECYYIGASAAGESYLNQGKIIQAALDTGAEAIHPGYGFLSENADFAEAVTKAGLVFIGPNPDSIRAMGGKSEAKALMEKAGVPLVPGYHGKDQNQITLRTAAQDMGYPVLIKASAGGGGKGMRVVETDAEFIDALDAAKREAQSAFGNDHVLVEKYLTRPRHVEIQVFGDNTGECVYLFERDCSIQRRHQKVIEEAPAPGMDAYLREQMGEAAVAATKAIDYIGAGTVEFLLDNDGRFYFMEMNTRLQVEHPVTEEITGIDLVEWQLRIAAGESLPKKQDEIEICGHAIEVRLYAEDPRNDFLPAAGQIEYLRYPADHPDVRIESAVREACTKPGDVISIHYDPMIAKIIARGRDRATALATMQYALKNTRIVGIKTNLGFLQNIFDHKAFQNADLTTGFIDAWHDDLIPSERPADKMSLAYGVLGLAYQRLAPPPVHITPWDSVTGWTHIGSAAQRFAIQDNDNTQDLDVVFQSRHRARVVFPDGESYAAEISRMPDDMALNITMQGETKNVSVIRQTDVIHTLYDGKDVFFTWNDPLSGAVNDDGGLGTLTAPMPGKIVSVNVKTGDSVTKGQTLVILEAMKMEHTITAPLDGEIESVNVDIGDQVDEKLELVVFK